MKSAIDKIFFGDIDPINRPLTEKLKNFQDKAFKIYEVLYESLTEEQKKQYDKMWEYESGRDCEIMLQCYKEGFKLGLALAAEALICG